MDCRLQLGKFRCLIIERHQLYAHFIRRTLYNLGINSVRIETDLGFSLKLLERSQYELIIADWGIKDKDTGLSLIQSLPSSQRDMYSIIYTCNENSRSMLSAAMAEGPEELILHPYSMKVLRTHILRGCENYLATIDIRKSLCDKETGVASVQCEDLMERDDLIGYWATRKLTEIYQHFSNYESVEKISRAVLQKRNAEWVRIALINALYEQGNHDDALVEAKEYVDVCGYSAKPYQLLGKCHNIIGEKEKALSAYEQARKLDPNDFDTLISCAAISMELGMHDKSISTYKRALQIASSSRNETPMLYINLANVIRKKNEDLASLMGIRKGRNPIDEANDIINMGAKKFPHDVMIQVYRAIISAKAEESRGNRSAANVILSNALFNYETFLHSDHDVAADFLLAMNSAGNVEQSRDLLYKLEFSGQIKALDKAREQMIRNEVGSNPKYMQASELHREGRELMKQNSSQQAIRRFKQAVDICPLSFLFNISFIECGIIYMKRYAVRDSLIDDCRSSLALAATLKTTEIESTTYHRVKNEFEEYVNSLPLSIVMQKKASSIY
jgi:tetratricopeptide (TPR) repeat protein